ncbi:MAG TPA: hypothetical protein VIL46_17235, partial [Gemmataceae bacterium]
RWKRLGRRLVTAKGCVNCHRIAPDGQELPQREDVASSLDKLLRPESHRRGCLAPSEKEAGKAPWFGFDQTERDGLAAFLRRGLEGAGSPAPAYHARLALKRFNCLNCHQRDGEGGLSAELVETMRRYQNAGAEEMITPPPLTGVGHKLRTPWLKQVLTQSGRARPWMGLRMPQYGEANVGTLDRGLTVLEGAEPDAGVHQVALTAAKIEAGRTLIGKNGFGCISCHDIAGIANTGTRGPELSTVNQRVRYEWFRRWLEQPQRMDPGTRMPQVFAGGRSLYPALLDGDADAQAEAMWAYLSLGPSLPLPFGLEPPPGLVIQVGERPEILRTFMPNGAGDRAVAVGYPGGVSAAFDAQQCRLAYAWAGNFLDASPVWANRGGAPAKLLGPVFWTSPPGNPWGSGKEPPDFATRAKDPAYGAALPDGQLYQGPMRVRFAGYTLDAAGLPTFRYRVEDGDGSALTIAETPRPAKSTVATGVLREFKLQGPASEPAWLLAGETGGAPTLFDGAGKPVELSLKQAPVEIPAEGNLLVLPAAGGQAQALTATAAPTGTRWVLRPRPGGGWLALLKLPPANGERTLSVVIWAVARPEPGLLRGLVEAKE